MPNYSKIINKLIVNYSTTDFTKQSLKCRNGGLPIQFNCTNNSYSIVSSDPSLNYLPPPPPLIRCQALYKTVMG